MGAGISGGGPRGAHEAGGAPRGAGSWPGGVAPDVFLEPNILKYSTKNHISFSGYLENFYFWGIFIARIIHKIDRKYYFCFI